MKLRKIWGSSGIVTSQEEGCSEFQIPTKIGSSKPVAHTAVSYITRLVNYWDKERKGSPRKTLTGDESMTKLTVERSSTSSHKKNSSS